MDGLFNKKVNAFPAIPLRVIASCLSSFSPSGDGGDHNQTGGSMGVPVAGKVLVPGKNTFSMSLSKLHFWLGRKQVMDVLPEQQV